MEDPVGLVPDPVGSGPEQVGSRPAQVGSGWGNEDSRRYYAYIGRESGVTMEESVMSAATLGYAGNYVARFRTEAEAYAALARREEELGVEEPRRACWAIVGGRGRVPGSRFTGIVENIADHNLAVIGASGVRNRKFHKRSEAQA